MLDLFRLTKGADESTLPPAGHTFETKLEKDIRQVYRAIQRLISVYKDEKRGPTYIAVQSPKSNATDVFFNVFQSFSLFI